MAKLLLLFNYFWNESTISSDTRCGQDCFKKIWLLTILHPNMDCHIKKNVLKYMLLRDYTTAGTNNATKNRKSADRKTEKFVANIQFKEMSKRIGIFKEELEEMDKKLHS